MLLLLSLGLAANAMFFEHPRAHHSQLPTGFMESAENDGSDRRGIDARNRTHKLSDYERKMAGIAREQAGARAAEQYAAKQERLAKEAAEQYAKNVRKAAEKLRIQRAFDARQEANAADDKQARIAEEGERSRLAQEAEQIECRDVDDQMMMGMMEEQERVELRMIEQIEADLARAIQAVQDSYSYGDCDIPSASNLLGDRVQAATDAERMEPIFARLEKARRAQVEKQVAEARAMQDETAEWAAFNAEEAQLAAAEKAAMIAADEAEGLRLQQANTDRRAQHKIDVAEAKARLEQIAVEAEQARAAKAETRRARQQAGRAAGRARRAAAAIAEEGEAQRPASTDPMTTIEEITARGVWTPPAAAIAQAQQAAVEVEDGAAEVAPPSSASSVESFPASRELTEEEIAEAAAAGVEMFPADHPANNLDHPDHFQFKAWQRRQWKKNAYAADPTKGMKWQPKAAEEEAAEVAGSSPSSSSTSPLEFIAASPVDAPTPITREAEHFPEASAFEPKMEDEVAADSAFRRFARTFRQSCTCM